MRKILSILSAAMLLCGFTAPQQHGADAPVTGKEPDSIRRVRLYTDALKRLVIYGDTVGARESARKVLSEYPGYAPALHLAARTESGDKQRLEMAEKAYLAEPDNKYYLDEFAQATLRAGRYIEAIDLYEKLLKYDPDPNNYRILAILYESNGQPLSAISTLDSAEVKTGRFPPLMQQRLRLYLSTMQFDKAESEAHRMIEEAPYMSDNYISLADVYAATGRDSLAMESYLKAISVDSTSVRPWIALSDFHYRRNDTPSYLSAMGHLFDSPDIPLDYKTSVFKSLTNNISFYRKNFAQLNALVGKLFINYPHDRGVKELYVSHLIKSGQIGSALDICKQIAGSGDATADDYINIIDMENFLERPDSAVLYTDRGIARFPENLQIRMRRGYTLERQNRHAEAADAYRQMLEYADTDSLRSDLWGMIGNAQYQSGDRKGCYRSFRKALGYFRDNATVLNNYAYFLSEDDRQLDKAMEMATRANFLSENNPTFLDTLAWILYRMGRYDEAKKYMQQAISLDRSPSAEIYIHYGDILYALGEDFMAQTYWRKALEQGYDAGKIEKRLEAQRERKAAAGSDNKKQ